MLLQMFRIALPPSPADRLDIILLIQPPENDNREHQEEEHLEEENFEEKILNSADPPETFPDECSVCMAAGAECISLSKVNDILSHL